jgi:hypothetical protein
MVNALRQEFLYSEKRARDAIFNEIASILDQRESPVILSKLTRETAARARQRSQEVGYAFSNWDTATKATVRAMLGAGVLLTQEGNPIPLTIAAAGAEVAALAEQFQDLTEAHMLEIIIRKLGDVTARDHTALAHALFRQFDPNIAIDEMEDRLVILLASLADRLKLAGGGTYVALD